MLEFLKHVLNGQNQFASGGLLLMIIGAVGAYLRAIPSRIWYWFVGQTTLSITVKDEDAAFAWVKQWFAEQKFLERIRRVDLDTTVRNQNLALIPAPGGTGSGIAVAHFVSTSIAAKTLADGRRSAASCWYSRRWAATRVSLSRLSPRLLPVTRSMSACGLLSTCTPNIGTPWKAITPACSTR